VHAVTRMKVDTISTSQTKAPRRFRPGAASFTIAPEAEGAGEAAGNEQLSAAPHMMNLAAMTASPPSNPGSVRESDHVAASHGCALLGALAGLQLASLDGDEVAARRTLAELARALPQATDPGLDSILQAIAQRAAIELARSE